MTKALAVGVMIALALGVLALRSEASHLRCHTGNVSGFVALREDPAELVGTLPSRFTADARFFSTRYNCMGRSVQARRVDQGLYEVRFPGVNVKMATADAISQEGISTSVLPITDGIVRVSLRGPLSGNDVATRRDVAFGVVVF